MKITAGVDIGNATTEVALIRANGAGKVEFLANGIVSTSGLKGTEENFRGVVSAIELALKKAKVSKKDLGLIRINEAAPVIGDVAMETITETIITESTMIGHNPHTPGGCGIGVGITVMIEELDKINSTEPIIVVISKATEFFKGASIINKVIEKGIEIVGAIVQNDDGVLINNRLNIKIPIVDEVNLIELIPLGMKAAIEVAPVGRTIDVLSNPYGIATLFNLSSDETKLVVPIARALIGNRSAVIIKTPKGDVKERRIPAGKFIIKGDRGEKTVDIGDGADKIMETLEKFNAIEDIKGEPGTNAGGMLERIRQVMSQLTDRNPVDINIQDLLAVDTLTPQKVKGGLAQEFSLENAVGTAAMVKADKLQMQMIAKKLQEFVNIPVEIGGVEADMAIKGALTTPGTNKPLAILDMGAGSTDASIIDKEGNIVSIHLAGAGNMVTMLINSELGLDSHNLAEEIKKYPLAKVESLYHIRHEDGTVQFLDSPLGPEYFSRVIILKEEGYIPLKIDISIEKIKFVRRKAKEKVFVTNALRALNTVSPSGNIRSIDFVVLVGGSALDFEVPQMITDALAQYGVVAGQGNIRGTEGPRNAVATGLAIDWYQGEYHEHKQ